MVFRYSGKDTQGIIVKGLVEAVGEKQAIGLLRSQEIYVISLQLVKKSIFSELQFKFSKVSFNNIVIFTHQLSTMISAGLTLTDAMSILKVQSSNPALAKMVSNILTEIEGGSSFAQALSKYPDQFSAIYVALVRAGEASGKLDEIIHRLAANLEKQREFRGKTKGALIYPVIILIGMLGVMTLMMIFVVPQLTSLYQEFGTDLPFTTRLMIKTSNLFVNFKFFIPVIIAGVVLLYRSWKKTNSGQHILDQFQFRLPVWGNLKKQMVLTEFSRTLGVLVGAGIPILKSLEIVSGSLASITYRDDLSKVAVQVEKGYPLGVPITQNANFPPILGQMITVGEETGKLDETLLKISEYFESETELGIKTLTTAMEPLIMVVLGVGVGFVVISILMPIYSLTSKF